MALTVSDDGHWIRAENEASDDIYVLMAEYAKSSRAACRRCSEKISKGEVRLGVPKKYSKVVQLWKA